MYPNICEWMLRDGMSEIENGVTNISDWDYIILFY